MFEQQQTLHQTFAQLAHFLTYVLAQKCPCLIAMAKIAPGISFLLKLFQF